MKMQIAILVLALSLAAVCGAEVYVYDFETRVGSGNYLTDDSWDGDNIFDWTATGGGPNASNIIYARSNLSADDNVHRENNAGWSFDIPDDTTHLTLEIEGRMNGQSASFWEAGLIDSGGAFRLGVGYDFGNDNQFHVRDNFDRADGTLAYTGLDTNIVIRLEVDLTGASPVGDLYWNDQLTLEDHTFSISPTTAKSMDAGLYIRTIDQYRGPSTFTITVIPEPSTIGLGVLFGILALVRKRLRKK